MLIAGGLCAQQNNNWYFGKKAAISFTNPAAPLKLGNSIMLADEASASISDDDGNLLFYTNGVDVYNRNHQLMLNGDNIGGHISASQVIIIPQPGSSNLYYIFTTDGVENNLQAGYNYSLVDMNLDNGYGQVTGKTNT